MDVYDLETGKKISNYAQYLLSKKQSSFTEKSLNDELKSAFGKYGSEAFNRASSDFAAAQKEAADRLISGVRSDVKQGLGSVSNQSLDGSALRKFLAKFPIKSKVGIGLGVGSLAALAHSLSDND